MRGVCERRADACASALTAHAGSRPAPRSLSSRTRPRGAAQLIHDCNGYEAATPVTCLSARISFAAATSISGGDTASLGCADTRPGAVSPSHRQAPCRCRVPMVGHRGGWLEAHWTTAAFALERAAVASRPLRRVSPPPGHRPLLRWRASASPRSRSIHHRDRELRTCASANREWRVTPARWRSSSWQSARPSCRWQTAAASPRGSSAPRPFRWRKMS